MKYTLGEKLGILKPKLIECTSETYSTAPCACGRGLIYYETIRGSRVSRYSVWAESMSFGRPDMIDCCQQCQIDQERRFEQEREDWI